MMATTRTVQMISTMRPHIREFYSFISNFSSVCECDLWLRISIFSNRQWPLTFLKLLP